MHRKWFASVMLMILMLIALWSSSLIVGEPTSQADATEPQGAVQSSLDQEQTQLAHTIRLATEIATESGYIAYFLQVPDGVSDEMNLIRNALTGRYGWQVEDISLSALANREVDFANPATTAEVLVIAGGSTPLSQTELAALQDYVGNGGNLIIFAGTNLNEGLTSLATARNLNTWLYQDFGLRFNNDVVIDYVQSFESALSPVSTNFHFSSFITTNGIPLQSQIAIFEAPVSITISPEMSANIVVTPLLYSTHMAYSSTELEEVLNNQLTQGRNTTQGTFILGASAENVQTGSRIVLFGSTSLGLDKYASLEQNDNAKLAFNSFIWTTRYDEYFNNLVERHATAIAQPLVENRATITPSATLPK